MSAEKLALAAGMPGRSGGGGPPLADAPCPQPGSVERLPGRDAIGLVDGAHSLADGLLGLYALVRPNLEDF